MTTPDLFACPACGIATCRDCGGPLYWKDLVWDGDSDVPPGDQDVDGTLGCPACGLTEYAGTVPEERVRAVFAYLRALRDGDPGADEGAAAITARRAATAAAVLAGGLR